MYKQFITTNLSSLLTLENATDITIFVIIKNIINNTTNTEMLLPRTFKKMSKDIDITLKYIAMSELDYENLIFPNKTHSVYTLPRSTNHLTFYMGADENIYPMNYYFKSRFDETL